MLKFSFYILLLILCIFFGFNNSTKVDLIIFPSSLEVNTRLYYIIFICFLCGYLISYILYSAKYLRLKMQFRSLRKRNVFLEKELEKNNVTSKSLLTDGN
mgnify:CR=1 FL=1